MDKLIMDHLHENGNNEGDSIWLELLAGLKFKYPKVDYGWTTLPELRALQPLPHLWDWMPLTCDHKLMGAQFYFLQELRLGTN